MLTAHQIDISIPFTLNQATSATIEETYSDPTIQQQHHPSLASKTKRLIDIVGAVVGLAITVVIAIPLVIAMQLDNPGPLLYSQIRCGYKGRYFRMWKFRSMVVNAEHLQHLVNNEVKGHLFKNENDPRITRVGRFLRRTSLDELPQFWNVLRGEMSLVGTRPPTPGEVKDYQPHHLERLNVKPGLTGEWQTHGRSSIKDFEQVIELDLEYQRKWSILYDLLLILKTFQVIFNQKGAC
ncbi:sugar transferase [Laspinema olomoucense]|uniref:sugar transferase n=1 Tax=Laspinema olomoucense TaxID=3231600 RepID=UPI0021BB934C|nr:MULTISPECIES: sugar transferase [unclassified Laspinema]MCT7986910.1 sugar transferase [Laspinema sp. D3a]MCT7995331.1 sugar transferase [Laspinema sp. D3c]